ncbi:MAG: hypothetical protein JWN01_877 [Patescibacteria group bacterium]|nr:hypothetical protein [Patescibacteria group bacterium]
MSDLITRTARLVPYTKRPKQVASFVTAYSYEPQPNEPGAPLGSLYVVLEVLISGRASEEVSDLVIETIGNHYYNEPPAGTEPLERFESAVKAVNHELTEHVNRGNAAWIGKLSAVVAIQAGDEVHVAATGSAEAYLYRGKSASHITGGSDTSRPTTPSKTFGSIATGQLEAGDRLLLATPALIHQVPLEKLQSVIGQTGPNTAIAELTELMHGAATDRIAAFVIEITTPELAALQVRSEQPNEIRLGSPENALEAAKLAAAPIAKTTVASGKKVAEAAGTEWKRAKPRLRTLGLTLAGKARQALSTTGGRRKALIALGVIVVILIVLVWRHQTSVASNQYFAKYQEAYAGYTRSQTLASTGQKDQAGTLLQSIQTQLTKLAPHESVINKKLGDSPLLQGEPRTMKEFTSLVTNGVDEIQGLIRVNYTTVATLPAKDTRPEHFEIAGGKAYIFDIAHKNALSIVTLASGNIKTSSIDADKLGAVINTTLSAANDGIYIVTNQPSVWFYRFDTDTLKEQPVAYGQWPAATAVASYLTNLYLLSEGTIYKHVKNATGFSPKTTYFLPDANSKAATALAVDGSIYLASPSGLHRYVAGTFKQSATLPQSIARIKNLRSTDDGTLLIGTDPASKRVGLWTASDTKLAFSKQIAPNGLKSLYDSTYDAKTGQIYAVADGRLIRFGLQR